jgi:hypothetical protein
MPDKRTVERARKDLRSGKSASTAAGEFVKSEIDKIRKGEHGAKNARQAIAIGLSEARRAGVPIPDKGRGSTKTKRRKSTRATRSAASKVSTRRTSKTRSAAALKALRKQPRRSASHLALSRQAHRVARKRSAASRSASAKKAARTRAQRAR